MSKRSHKSDELKQTKKDKLWKLCKQFIEEHKISCGEATYEDRVYENAPDLVNSIGKIVGWYKYKDKD